MFFLCSNNSLDHIWNYNDDDDDDEKKPQTKPKRKQK